MKIIKITCSLILYLITMEISAQQQQIKLTINNDTTLIATLVNNSSTATLAELLNEEPLTIEMRDYGNMEKVGPIGTNLPRNDEQITTEAGDLILYQGNAFVIYYAPNSWNFTRLGKIDNTTQDELKSILGEGDVTVTLELYNPTSINENNDFGNIKVYPNPVNDNLNVTGKYESITLMDLHGNIIRSKDDILDMSNIEIGLYFLLIKSKNHNTLVKKVLKN